MFEKRNRLVKIKNRIDGHVPHTPNGLPISRRERAGKAIKKRTIPRAQRSAAWACSAAGLSFPSAARMTAPRRHAITWHDGR